MESMEKKEPRPRRSFTPEFKAEIVELCRRGNRPVGQIAKLGFNRSRQHSERHCPFTVWRLFFRIGRPVRRRLHSSRGITFHRVV